MRRLVLTTALWLVATAPVWPQSPPEAAARRLQAQRAALEPQLRASAFGQPLHLSSLDEDGQVSGDVHAELAHPLAEIAAAFTSADAVCALLFLHLNVRGCQPSPTKTLLTVTVGPKRGQAAGTRFRMRYAMQVEASTPTYLKVTLTAAQGPLATEDYRIVLEAVPTDTGHAFVHLGYAYRYGFIAKSAMRAYLATTGWAKIGFTVLGRDAHGRLRYVQGERAALERNVIRYHLALLAHLSARTGSPAERMQARLRAWFALTERYAAQLHELDLDEYLREKGDDLGRGNVPVP